MRYINSRFTYLLTYLIRLIVYNTVAQTLVQAFISCRLDYCNSLFYGIADSQLKRLQSVQNAAA